LGVSVEAIETFDEKAILKKGLEQEDDQLTPVDDILGYFRAEISKRDQLIRQLRMELSKAAPNNERL